MDADRIVAATQSAAARAASPLLLDWLRAWETLRLQPYRDGGGRWTVGYGCLLDDSDSPSQCITADEADALVAFSYNVGAGGFARSTIRLKINSGQIEEAADYFKLWNQVRSPLDGKLYPSVGLDKRRAAEAAMYEYSDYSLRP